jgi:hypothetical protein
MTEHEMAARLIVLEVICMSTLGILFTMTRQTDPGHKKALETLDAVRQAIRGRLGASGDPKVLNEGEAYLDELLSELSGGLELLRSNS